MIELEKAQELLIQNAKRYGNENVYIEDAYNRILYEDVLSPIYFPPFNQSLVDGYALGDKWDEYETYNIIDTVYAGHALSKTVENNSVIKVTTGTCLPKGTIRVVKYEDCIVNNNSIILLNKAFEKNNFIEEGSLIKKNEAIAAGGTVLSSKEITNLATCGINKVNVYKKPKVGILSTGDELVSLGHELEDGKIYCSNLYMLGALLKEHHCNSQIIGIAPDNADIIEGIIADNIDKFDLLITTGGVGPGEKDTMYSVLDNLNSNILFNCVNVKPGKFVNCAVYKDKLIVNLSGRPESASKMFKLIVKTILCKMLDIS